MRNFTFEDGIQFYGLNAKTYYAGISYEIANIELETLYGITNMVKKTSKKKELNLSLNYNLQMILVWV